MGQFMVCLAHFCEIHGPSVVMCTQSTALDRAEEIAAAPPTASQLCSSCRLIIPKSEGDLEEPSSIRTVEAGRCYTSSQYPSSQPKYSALRQIVMKSLSVEMTYDSSAPIMFGDQAIGYSVVMTFKVRDSLARGSERKYALMVIGEQEGEVIHSWDLIVGNIQEIIVYVRDRLATVESDRNDEVGNERFFRRAQMTKPKSLVELLHDDRFFVRLHLWAASLLKDCSATA
ncbi:unnamed protein product [Kuraishia capsulata CBS 1993]|uniref:UDENN FLCN/SMCR8-type domain-containing protein n=1 Tax=Kuraishia capsulata CBS 1993 TaxID=1382522 RepID=W6MSP2_9ASCO|nr:uncharacterized protein KUCA_T00004229001 [Kuraishia capsulata CBS 1993]CDK28247.1 unnamed protein product [Kuraishia capsulata CBS 1993]